MTTFIWNVLSMDVDTATVDSHSDLVTVVYWTCTAAQNVSGTDYEVYVSRNTKIVYDAAHPYVQYADLTEAEVLEWVWNSTAYTKKGTPDTVVTVKEATETELQQNIDDQSAPAVTSPPLPW